mgnify:CR=1 FL=1
MDSCEPTTTGGNTTVVNGDEQAVHDRCVQIPVRAEGCQDGELH